MNCQELILVFYEDTRGARFANNKSELGQHQTITMRTGKWRKTGRCEHSVFSIYQTPSRVCVVTHYVELRSNALQITIGIYTYKRKNIGTPPANLV